MVRSSRPIVVVDDNDVDLRLTEICFRHAKLDCSLVSLRSGAALFDYLERASRGEVQAPAIVLLDVNMPVMSGFQVLLGLVRTYGESFPRVWMMSNSDNPADIERALQLGAVDYFVKPTMAADYIAFFRSLQDEL